MLIQIHQTMYAEHKYIIFKDLLQIEEHIKEIRSVSDTVRSSQKVEKHFHAFSITSSCIWDWKQKTFGVLLIKAIVKKQHFTVKETYKKTFHLV